MKWSGDINNIAGQMLSIQ